MMDIKATNLFSLEDALQGYLPELYSICSTVTRIIITDPNYEILKEFVEKCRSIGMVVVILSNKHEKILLIHANNFQLKLLSDINVLHKKGELKNLCSKFLFANGSTSQITRTLQDEIFYDNTNIPLCIREDIYSKIHYGCGLKIESYYYSTSSNISYEDKLKLSRALLILNKSTFQTFGILNIPMESIILDKQGLVVVSISLYDLIYKIYYNLKNFDKSQSHVEDSLDYFKYNRINEQYIVNIIEQTLHGIIKEGESKV